MIKEGKDMLCYSNTMVDYIVSAQQKFVEQLRYSLEF